MKKSPARMSQTEQIAQLKSQLSEVQSQLMQAERLTAVGELAGTTTHEFNNILMTVMNYAKLAMRRTDEASRTMALERILEASMRAAKITQTILGAARNRSSAMEPTDLAQLVRDSLVLLEKELSKYRISVDLQISDTPPALAYGNQILQVLLNLVINARQAMSDGGTMTITVRPSGSNMAELIVRDSGKGIPADVLPKIFDPFYSTKKGPDGSGKGGSGLGLSSCRNIIEAHEGRIRVASAPGKGTAFSIRLPIAKPNPGIPESTVTDTPIRDQSTNPA